MLKHRLESCSEREVTSCEIGKISRRMSPVTNLIEPVSDGQGRFVIVLGAVDNTLGVSVLGVSPWADAG